MSVGSLLAAGVAPAIADSCPNAQYRTGYSRSLPDCRAYELVSPTGARPYLASTAGAPTPDKQNAADYAVAADSGNALGWFSIYPPAGSDNDGMAYRSARSASGWSTEAMIPPQSPSAANWVCPQAVPLYSPDLSKAVLTDGFYTGPAGQSALTGGYCGSADPVLVPGEPQGQENLLLETIGSGAYGLLNAGAASGAPPANAEFQDGAADLSDIFFEDQAQLTANAPSGIDLYESSGGAEALVSVLPDGTPVPGYLANAEGYNPVPTNSPDDVGGGPGLSSETNAVSSDGSRVFFQADGNLYLRENPMAPESPLAGGECAVASDACTIQLDATRGGSGPGGGGTFAWASSDGSIVYFLDNATAGLTSDTVAGSGTNLYEYDVSTGSLTDLTAVAGADVEGVMAGGGDGPYLYFVATSVLAAGATAGDRNLYVSHGGQASFIATLSASDPPQASSKTIGQYYAAVSPDGAYLAFDSTASLTGYNNDDASTGSPDLEVYLYDAANATLNCLSCDSSGAQPVGQARLAGPENLDFEFTAPLYAPRQVLDSGRVFFGSPDRLVPAAANGVLNVFEFEPDGVGSCGQSAGCLALISSGSSSDPSFFYDASASGDDVFFLSSQDLTGVNVGGVMSVYDARVGGGFPAAATPAPTCADTGGCQGLAPAPPPASSVGTVTFSGPGDQRGVTPASVGAVKVTGERRSGGSFALTVRTPAGGRLTITGTSVKRVTKAVGQAGSYRLTVRLNAAAMRRLKKQRRMRVAVRVAYTPGSGKSSSALVSVELKA